MIDFSTIAYSTNSANMTSLMHSGKFYSTLIKADLQAQDSRTRYGFQRIARVKEVE